MTVLTPEQLTAVSAVERLARGFLRDKHILRRAMLNIQFDDDLSSIRRVAREALEQTSDTIAEEASK